MRSSTGERLIKWIHEIARAHTLETLTAVVARALRDMVDAQGAAFVVKDRDECVYVDVDAIEPLWKGQRFPLTACVCGWSILNRKPAVVANVLDDFRTPVQYYRGRFIRSLLIVPVRSPEPVGALGVYWAQTHTASDEDIAAVQTLADAAAVGMENIRLLASLEESRASAERRAEENSALSARLTVSEGRMRSMMQELDHRVKNTLASVLSVCDQTFVAATSSEEFRSAFRGRVQAMARTHEALAAAHWSGARLREIALLTLGSLTPERGEGPSRLAIEGPDILLPAAAATPVAATLHELATNSVKHGAWSEPDGRGRVMLSWHADERDAMVRVLWREMDGPPVESPAEAGFGLTLIRGMIEYELRGKCDVRFERAGLVCEMSIPWVDPERAAASGPFDRRGAAATLVHEQR